MCYALILGIIKVKRLATTKTGYKVRIISECSSYCIGSRLEAYSVKDSRWFRVFPLLENSAKYETDVYIQFGRALGN